MLPGKDGFRRVGIVPDLDGLTAEKARALLTVKFSKADIARVTKLSALARKGTLTDEQRSALEGYLQFGHFLTLLHSRARMALKRRGSSALRRKSA
jgi:hypothetical protein